MTDLAEVVGGAIALHLLFGLAAHVGRGRGNGIQPRRALPQGARASHFESVVLVLLAVIIGSLLWQVLVADVDRVALLHSVAPGPLDSSAALLAVGIVVPRSCPTRCTSTRPPRAPATTGPSSRRRWSGCGSAADTVRSVVLAMSVAGMANVSLVVFSAALPSEAGASIESAYAALGAQAGQIAATMLAVALLASGLASTLVGVQTGDVVMTGFGKRPIPALVRRMLAVVPTLIILGVGVEPTNALVWSQVVLSFALPGTLIPLLLFTHDRRLMGRMANHRLTTVVAWLITAVIVGLVGFLLVSGA